MRRDELQEKRRTGAVRRDLALDVGNVLRWHARRIRSALEQTPQIVQFRLAGLDHLEVAEQHAFLGEATRVRRHRARMLAADLRVVRAAGDPEEEVGGASPEPVEGSAPCDKCGAEMVMKRGRFGPFLACSNYPECKTTRRLVKDASGQVRAAEDKILDEKCPECGQPLAQKHGRFGDFIACSTYPTCRYNKAKEVGVDCPRDQCKGKIVERRSRRGKLFSLERQREIH